MGFRFSGRPLHTSIARGETGGGQAITIPSHVYFHLWQQDTYINFASSTTLGAITQTNNMLYLDQYWFNVEGANLTISNFFLNRELALVVRSSSENTSATTVIYVSDRGEPTSVYATNGTLTWNYEASTKVLTLRVACIARAHPVEIVVSWGVLGDINNDGVVDFSDLTELNNAYGSDPSKNDWDDNCDINRDGIVEAFDLLILGENYGKTTP